MYIYKITNQINGKLYIGKTKNPSERMRAHFRMNDSSKVLYQAMEKYGKENFIFEIIEECSDNEWEIKEQYWIDYYDSMVGKNGYNMIPGGSEPPHPTGEDHPMSKLTQKDVSEIKILLIKNEISMREISRRYNIGIDQIYRINTGESWSKKEEEKFPLRMSPYLNQEDVDQIIWYLQNTKYTQKEIGILFGKARTTITAINRGQNFCNPNISYPIRTGRNYNKINK